MTNSLAVSGISNLRMDDPYLIQALKYQSPYTNLQGQNTQVTGIQGNGTQSAVTNQQIQTNFKGTPSAEQNIKGDKKSKGKSWGLILGLAVVCAGILFHKKGNADLGFWERIKDGAKTCYNSVFGKVAKAASVEAPELTKTLEKDADGVAKTVLNDGIRLKSYDANIGGYEIKYRNGTVLGLKENGIDILGKYKDKADTTVKDVIDNYISSFEKGQNLESLSNLSFKYNKSGIEHYLFHRQNPTDVPKFIAGLKKG